MDLTSAPFDLQPVLEMVQRQPVGTSLSALVKRERSNHSAMEAPTGKCGATIVHLLEHASRLVIRSIGGRRSRAASGGTRRPDRREPIRGLKFPADRRRQCWVC